MFSQRVSLNRHTRQAHTARLLEHLVVQNIEAFCSRHQVLRLAVQHTLLSAPKERSKILENQFFEAEHG